MSDEEAIEPDEIDVAPCDPVAERVAEYTRLAKAADGFKDKELKKEAFRMLARIRLSFKAMSEANVTSLPGGKSMDKPL